MESYTRFNVFQEDYKDCLLLHIYILSVLEYVMKEKWIKVSHVFILQIQIENVVAIFPLFTIVV